MANKADAKMETMNISPNVPGAALINVTKKVSILPPIIRFWNVSLSDLSMAIFTKPTIAKPIQIA